MRALPCAHCIQHPAARELQADRLCELLKHDRDTRLPPPREHRPQSALHSPKGAMSCHACVGSASSSPRGKAAPPPSQRMQHLRSAPAVLQEPHAKQHLPPRMKHERSPMEHGYRRLVVSHLSPGFDPDQKPIAPLVENTKECPTHRLACATPAGGGVQRLARHL
jgi:hypothetical protein